MRQHQKKIKKKDKFKELNDGAGVFCPKKQALFSFLFSPQFGEIGFWWAWRENFWAPPFSPSISTINQTHFSPIFSSIFYPSCFLPNQTDPQLVELVLLKEKGLVLLVAKRSRELGYKYIYRVGGFVSVLYSNLFIYFFWSRVFSLVITRVWVLL